MQIKATLTKLGQPLSEYLFEVSQPGDFAEGAGLAS